MAARTVGGGMVWTTRLLAKLRERAIFSAILARREEESEFVTDLCLYADTPEEEDEMRQETLEMGGRRVTLIGDPTVHQLGQPCKATNHM